MSTLPGLRYGREVSLFPRRVEFLQYLARYAKSFDLNVECNRDVTRLVRKDDAWHATFATGEVDRVSHVVMATGIASKPRTPAIPGSALFQGQLVHSIAYKRPGPFVGKRVVVVGIGNSGGEIGGELARSGAKVTVVIRSGQNVVPKQIGPFPAQYVRFLVGKLPRKAQEVVFARVQARMEKQFGPPVIPRPTHSALDAIPLIGFILSDCIREGLIEVKRGHVAGCTPEGAVLSSGEELACDVILLATGFEAALDSLGDQVRRDAKGFAMRTDRVTSADQPALWFVGQNYDHTGGLTNIRRDAPAVAAQIARQLRQSLR